MNIKLIGFQGFMGSGKDTASDYLIRCGGFVKDSFAASLKDICASMFQWDRDLLEGKTKESRKWRETIDVWWSENLNMPDFTPRKALQLIGTEVFRMNFHEDIWLLTFKRRLFLHYNNVLISDCRFKNEINFFKKIGGKIILVDDGTRPEWYSVALEANCGNVDALSEMQNKYYYVHRSEWDWIGTKPNAVIMNDFKEKNEETLSIFYTRIDDAIKNI